MFIKDAYTKINKRIVYNFDNIRATVKEQKDYLDLLPEPKDDFDLAYNHYRTLNFYAYEKWMTIFFNIIAIFLLPVIWVKNMSRTIPESKGEKAGSILARALIKTDDILPPDLVERYGEFRIVERSVRRGMDAKAKEVFRSCARKYFFHPYFLLINLQKLIDASLLIEDNNPKAIVVFAKERDFSAPIVSLYCEKLGIEYVSFMHGDYTYSIDKAYQRFSRYYVWDEHYIKMFTELKWNMDKYEIYIPEKLKGIVQPHEDGQYEYYITYYFGAESEKRIRGVHQAFKTLRKAGYNCKIRPHPRFSNIEYLKSVFDGFYIENPKQVTLEESLDATKYAVALNSTVLSQAYYSGKEYVIDDYSDSARFASLEDRQYIMLSKPHKLLSQLVQEAENK